MKNHLSILLLLVCLNVQSCAQNEDWQELLAIKQSPIQQYDIDFIKYVAEDELDEEFKNQEKFKFLNSLGSMYKINDESLLESHYMVKPNNNLLLALYLRRKIAWSSFNQGIIKKSRKAVIYEELKTFPNSKELLSFYYSEIFIQVLNKKWTYNPNEINLDYNKLNNHISNLKWATKREKEIHQFSNPDYKKPEKLTTAKLSENDVRRLKKILNDPNRRTRLKIIARRFGVTTMQLRRIKTGENWSHIEAL